MRRWPTRCAGAARREGDVGAGRHAALGHRLDATRLATSLRPSSSTSPAPRTRHRSPSRSSSRRTGAAASKVGSHRTGRPPAASAAASATSRPRDAGEVLGALARRVDVEHGGHVGPGQRGPEVACEPLRARVEVGLEDRDHPPRAPACGRRRWWRPPRSGGGRSRRSRARRCSWCPGAWKRRPAPAKSASAAAAAAGSAPASTRGLQGGGGVARVVGARDGQAHGVPAPLEARAAAVERRRGDVEGHVGSIAAQREHVGAVPQDGLRRAGQATRGRPRAPRPASRRSRGGRARRSSRRPRRRAARASSGPTRRPRPRATPPPPSRR